MCSPPPLLSLPKNPSLPKATRARMTTTTPNTSSTCSTPTASTSVMTCRLKMTQTNQCWVPAQTPSHTMTTCTTMLSSNASQTWNRTPRSTVTPRGSRKSTSNNCKASTKRKKNSTRRKSSCKMNATWSTPTTSSPVKALTSTERNATPTTSMMMQWMRGTSSNCCATRRTLRTNNLCWGKVTQTWRRTARSNVSKSKSCTILTLMTKPMKVHLLSWENLKQISRIWTRLPTSMRSTRSCCSSWTTTTSTSSPKCRNSTMTAFLTLSPCRPSERTHQKQLSIMSNSANWLKRTTTPSLSGDSTVWTLKMRTKCLISEQAWMITKTSTKPSSRNKSKCLKNLMMSTVMKCLLWRLLRVILMMRLKTKRSLRNNLNYLRVWTTCKSKGVKMLKICQTWRHQDLMKVQVRMSN